MLGSDYRELIVPRTDNSAKKTAVLFGGGAAVLLTCFLALLSGRMLFLLLPMAAGFATWYFYIQNCIEYEYVISGDELVITKILAESKRKPMLTVSILKFNAFGNLRDAEPLGSGMTLVLACSEQNSDTYYADFDHSEYGRTRLLLSPNPDILLYLAKKLPRSLGFRYVQEEQASDIAQ